MSPTGSNQKSSEQRVFISWGGKEALAIGEWLKEVIDDTIPGHCGFISSQNIQSGENFSVVLDQMLRTAKLGICIVTDVTLDRPWVLYEIASLRNRVPNPPNVFLIRLGDRFDLDHPLGLLQDIDGSSFVPIYQRILAPLIDSALKGPYYKLLPNAHRVVMSKAAEWEVLIRPIQDRSRQTASVRASASKAIRAIQKYRDSDASFTTHSVLQDVYCKSLDDVTSAFHGLVEGKRRSWAVDYRRYPEYLERLQKDLNVVVNAIAIIEDREEFWAHKTGDAILASSNRLSQRIFVFRDADQFDSYFEAILAHSERYKTFVMPASRLRQYVGRMTGDYAIIQDPVSGQRAIAAYDSRVATIEFTSDQIEVAQKEKLFAQIVLWATPLQHKAEGSSKSLQAEIRNRLFPGESDAAQAHSDAIPIEIYDLFEEDHPFYSEMQNTMLSEFRQRADGGKRTLELLEVGAGTGLFTKRLAQQTIYPLEIHAIEPDSRAHELFYRKFHSKVGRVHLVHESILNYEAPHDFQFVFSSFSEHHIEPGDKAKYFSIILRALEPGGYLVIGDEFLAMSATEEENPEEYDEALARYHDYIIAESLAAHHPEVADLERHAKEHGKRDATPRVDYKVSVAWYKSQAKISGLLLEAEHCISPVELAGTVGGIYVLVFRKPLTAPSA